MKNKIKNIKVKYIKIFLSVLILLAICLGSAISVSALNKKYIITDGNNVISVVSLPSSPETIIEKSGITLGEKDDFSVDNVDGEVTNIIIRRAFNVELTDGTEIKNLSANFGTVKDLLESNEIFLNENDIINVTLDTEIAEGMQIKIDRVEYKEIKESLDIPFETINQKTDNLNKGETKVQTIGENGKKEVTKIEKYVNGNLAETQLAGETVVKPAVNQVNVVGTKVKKVKVKQTAAVVDNGSGEGTLTDSDGNTVNYKKLLKGTCTAYTAKKGEGSATGRPLKVGNVAVDPKKIPYGTRLYIPGYGYAVASDTGGAMRSGRALIDLYYNSEAECRAFGRRAMEVYILN